MFLSLAFEGGEDLRVRAVSQGRTDSCTRRSFPVHICLLLPGGPLRSAGESMGDQGFSYYPKTLPQ